MNKKQRKDETYSERKRVRDTEFRYVSSPQRFEMIGKADLAASKKETKNSNFVISSLTIPATNVRSKVHCSRCAAYSGYSMPQHTFAASTVRLLISKKINFLKIATITYTFSPFFRPIRESRFRAPSSDTWPESETQFYYKPSPEHQRCPLPAPTELLINWEKIRNIRLTSNSTSNSYLIISWKCQHFPNQRVPSLLLSKRNQSVSAPLLFSTN